MLLLLLAAMWIGPRGAFAAPQPVGTFAADRGDPRILWRAELAISDAVTPPGAEASWQPVTFPDSWRPPERRALGSNGWYRFRLQGPAPREPTSLYLWRYSMNAAVWFNGQWLADGGSFDEPVARNWNRPMLVALPATAWREGPNELLVRLRVYPGFGQLLPPAIGPTIDFAADFERRVFAQVTMAQIAAAVMALACVFGIALWCIDRRDPLYLAFAGLCATLVVYSADKAVRDLPVSAATWWWLVHIAADACAVMLFLTVHRALGVARPRLERVLVGCLLVFATLYAVVDLPTLARWNPLTHAVGFAGLVYLLGWLLLRLVRQRDGVTALYAAVLLTLMVAGGYDTLLNATVVPELWSGGFFLLPLAMPVVLFGLMLQLALRSVRAAARLRAANDTLEARVRAASAEIAATYTRERQLLAERAAAQERERIYRDLHDNLGARLLGLVYGAEDARQRARARAALAEMRTLVAASHIEPATLEDATEEWRVEAELRCENAGIALAWSLQGDAWLPSRQRYQCECIVRELISNAIEHGRGRRIDVAWRSDGTALELRVCDDGVGLPAGVVPASVAARAADLQGDARWCEGPRGGTLCVVGVRVAAATSNTPAGPTP